ncbi:MAG: c-type cytochrome [Elusimicrobia bacterium]|nr:c-type cytochrome [Elusimicrobiota bacterium]
MGDRVAAAPRELQGASGRHRGALRVRRYGLTVAACLLAVAALGASPAWADGYKQLARELAKTARREGTVKVAVLPFVFLNRPVSVAPVLLSERLAARLGGEGGVQLVERALVGKLLAEHRLALTGALDAQGGARVGRLLQVDAVVTGTLTHLGDRKIEVNARLIRADTGLVLGTATQLVREDWKETFAAGPAPTGGTPPIDLSMVSVPQTLYTARCARCHGDDGAGPDRRDLTRPAVQAKTDVELERAISGGGELMPAFGETFKALEPLSEGEVSALASVVRELGRERRKRDSSLRAGAVLFERHCAACHGYDGRGMHLAAGLFEVPPAALDLTRSSPAYSSAQLAELLRVKKRKMLFRGELSEQALTGVWLYLQKLSKR